MPDILTENYRPGVLDEMGLTAARLAEINPDLNRGQREWLRQHGGPMPTARPLDFIAQAMSGYMATNGHARNRAASGRGAAADGPYRGAVRGAGRGSGLARARAGRALRSGWRPPMMMSIISMMAISLVGCACHGARPGADGQRSPESSRPTACSGPATGIIAVSPSTDVYVARFLAEIGLSHLLDDPRFSKQHRPCREPGRVEPELVDEAVGRETQAYWIERLNGAGVPCGKVQSLTEALADPQVAAQGMVLEVPHPGHGAVKMTGFPGQVLADTAFGAPHGAGPRRADRRCAGRGGLWAGRDRGAAGGGRDRPEADQPTRASACVSRCRSAISAGS